MRRHPRRRRADAAGGLPAGVRRVVTEAQAGPSCAPTTRSTGSSPARTAGCSPRCYGTSGASTGSSSPTGAPSHDRVAAGEGRAGPGGCRRSGARGKAAPGGGRGGDIDEARGGLAVGGWLTASRGLAESTDARFDVEAHHAFAASSVAELHRPALERRRTAPAGRRGCGSPSSGSSPAPRATRAAAPPGSTRPGSTTPWTPSGRRRGRRGQPSAPGIRARRRADSLRPSADLVAEAVAAATRCGGGRRVPRPARRRTSRRASIRDGHRAGPPSRPP